MRGIAIGVLLLAACGPTAWPANGPRSDVEYWRAECVESSGCWGVVHEQCPDGYAIDERDGQQVTKGAMVNGMGGLNSHREQAWLFHCTHAKQ